MSVGLVTATLQRLAKADATLAEMAAATGLSVAQVLYRLNPPPRSQDRIYTRKINMRLDPEMYAQILFTAARTKTTPAETMRTFIEWGLEQCD